MKIFQAIQSYKDYHSINSKKNTVKNYQFIFTQFKDEFGDRLTHCTGHMFITDKLSEELVIL